MTLNINIDLGNLLEDIDTLKHAFKQKLDEISSFDAPEFARYSEDISKIRTVVKKYKDVKNLVVIGSGGSNTSFFAFYNALYRYDIFSDKNVCCDKHVYIVKTMEPHFLKYLEKRCCRDDTLIVAISKSGKTLGVLESLFAFPMYPVLSVTENKDSALCNLSKTWNVERIDHPSNIGGRYSGTTSCAYTPSMILDIDVEAIENGAKDMYDRCSPSVPFENNPALRLSAALFYSELKKYREIFLPIYSTKLAGFLPLITQLIHESSCKNGKGQTVFGDFAPESQHHTNQRFFGGYSDVFGIFIAVSEFEDSDYKIRVPDNIEGIGLDSSTLNVLDGLKYSDALKYEMEGVVKHTKDKSIPFAIIELDKVTPYSVGELLAFWQYVAVYSSWFRDVDPFNQPEVEYSKKHTFDLIKGRHNNHF